MVSSHCLCDMRGLICIMATRVPDVRFVASASVRSVFKAADFGATIRTSAAIFHHISAMFAARRGRRNHRLLLGSCGDPEVRLNGLRVDLAFRERCKVVVDGLFFVESDLAGIGADKPFIKDAAGKLVEVLVFERLQHTGADLGGVGEGLERDATLFALLAEFFPEGVQQSAPSGIARMGLMIGEGGDGCQKS